MQLEEIVNNHTQVKYAGEKPSLPNKLQIPTQMFAKSEGTPALLKTVDEK